MRIEIFLLGRNSSYYNETGDDNVVLGYGAAQGVTGNSFVNNVIIGKDAALVIETASQVVAIGKSSGLSLTTGINNTLVGAESGRGITTGTYNTVLGNRSMYINATGDYNVCVGKDAGRGLLAAKITQTMFS